MSDVYVGAYVECKTHLVDNTYPVRVCSNPECRQDFTGEEFAFCSKCGSRVVDAMETREKDLPAVIDWLVSKAIAEALARVQVPLETDCVHLWIPNKRREHYDVIRPAKFGGEPGNYSFLTEESVDPARAKAAFAEDFAKELEHMRNVYDSVDVKWGIFNYLTW